MQHHLALEQRRLRVSRHSCHSASGTSSRKNPKIVVMSPTVETKIFKKKEAVWQQCHLRRDVSEHQILGGNTTFFFGTRIRKDLVVAKGAMSPEKKVPLPLDPPAWRETQVDSSQSRQFFCVHWRLVPGSRERVVFTEWQVRIVLGVCMSRAKVIPALALFIPAICTDQ